MKKFCFDWYFTYVRITISMYFSIQSTQEPWLIQNTQLYRWFTLIDLAHIYITNKKKNFKPAKMNKYTSNSNASDKDMRAIAV